MTSAAFGLQNIISLASRERCMTNLNKIRMPSNNKTKKLPSATAAVLVPLCHVNRQACILYTVRSAKLRTDRGIISFPGGKTDRTESPIETALRETKEEIGLSSDKVDIWGYGQALPGRKQMVTPVIGCLKELKKENFSVNRNEVSEVFAVPLEVLSDPKNQFHTQFQSGDILPVFTVDEYKIWGITAYMTHIFLSCLLPKDVYRNDFMRKRLPVNK